MQAIIDRSNVLAAHLYAGAAAAGTGQNLILCPLNVTTVLSQLLAGSIGQGHASLRSFLGCTETDAIYFAGLDRVLKAIATNQGVTHVGVADSLWVDQACFAPAGVPKALRTWIGADLHRFDATQVAATSQQMNDWIAVATRGHITGLGGPILHPSPVIPLSAFVLEAQWSYAFHPKQTVPGPFTTPTGVVTVPMMHDPDDESLALRVPGGALAIRHLVDGLTFVVILPDAANGLPAFERQIRAGSLPTWLKQAQYHRCDWSVPVLDLAPAQPCDVLPFLQDGGLAVGTRADYPFLAPGTGAMASNQPALITTILQRSSLSVHENGIIAASASRPVMFFGDLAVDNTIVAMHLDRPFAWFVMNDCLELILMEGRVLDPTTR